MCAPSTSASAMMMIFIITEFRYVKIIPCILPRAAAERALIIDLISAFASAPVDALAFFSTFRILPRTQDCLKTSCLSPFSRSTCGITLDDKDLTSDGIAFSVPRHLLLESNEYFLPGQYICSLPFLRLRIFAERPRRKAPVSRVSRFRSK